MIGFFQIYVINYIHIIAGKNMRKKICIIGIVVSSVALVMTLLWRVLYMFTYVKEVLKTEYNGMVFETLEYKERNDLDITGVGRNEYYYTLRITIKIKITNNNDEDVNVMFDDFQLILENCKFEFYSAKNVSTNQTYTNAEDFAEIPAKTDATFEIVLRSNGYKIDGSKEFLNNKIYEYLINQKSQFKNSSLFKMYYQTVLISQAKVNMVYYDGATLREYAVGNREL